MGFYVTNFVNNEVASVSGGFNIIVTRFITTSYWHSPNYRTTICQFKCLFYCVQNQDRTIEIITNRYDANYTSARVMSGITFG